MPLEKNRRRKNIEKTLDENKNENLTHKNVQQNKIVIENNEETRNKYVDDYANEGEDQLNTSQVNNPLYKTSRPQTKISKSPINANDIVDNSSSFEHLKQINNVDKTILEGVDIFRAKKPIYNVEQLESTNIKSESVSVDEKPKYDLSIYDYDEEDSSDELQRINAFMKCKFCSHVAETPMDLLRHKRDAHKVQKRTLPLHEIRKYFDYPDRTFCPICEQPIKSRNFRCLFVKHLLVHTTIFYDCRICKKKFKRLDHMRTHEKRHVFSYAELMALQDTVDNNPVELPLLTG